MRLIVTTAIILGVVARRAGQGGLEKGRVSGGVVMKPVLKWGGIIAASSAGLIALAVAYVFIASQMMLDRTYPKRPSAVRAPATAEAIARGRHLVVIAGCTDCHGRDLMGKRVDVPGSTVYAPNLTTDINKRSDADIDCAIRQSLLPDERSVVVMPSHAYAGLTDGEVASIIAYLRSLKIRGTASPPPSFGLMVRAGLVAGVFKTEAAALAGAKPPLDLGARYARGRHLAAIVCGQCHGTDLSGTPEDPVVPTPDLLIIAAYNRSDFRTLLRRGKAVGGRELGLMSQVSRGNFSSLTDEEIDALYDYLDARERALTAGEKNLTP